MQLLMTAIRFCLDKQRSLAVARSASAIRMDPISVVHAFDAPYFVSTPDYTRIPVGSQDQRERDLALRSFTNKEKRAWHLW